MKEALINLKNAGCKVVYLDGSFISSKHRPNDFDACWEPLGVNPNLLDPVLLNFAEGRKSQKEKFGGELFLASMPSGLPGKTILELFQTDREAGQKKGIICINLEAAI